MTEKMQVYKCEICGNMVEVVGAGGGTLVCCGKPMSHVVENSTDAAAEKHIPVIEKVDGGYQVTVGAVLHPNVEEHNIPWIELMAGGAVYRQDLPVGTEPRVTFAVDAKEVTARAYCNLHGLWKG